METPEVIAVYSETGGATKTATAVSLAAVSAIQGHKTVLIDLDPRAAATKWIGAEPKGAGLDVAAILADPDPDGWADDLAVATPWTKIPALRVVPASRAVSNREAAREDHSDIRLSISLNGIDADRVIIDCPNRQGGPLIQNALTAATKVVYAAKLDEDGLDGVDGAHRSVQRFRKHRKAIGATTDLEEAGIIVGRWTDTIQTRDARRCERELLDAYPQLVLDPYVPERVIVRESRSAGTYYGLFRDGEIVHNAYVALARKVFSS
ncbi:ParA family protein [Nocardia takedensis]|uniref:ParA family protein n=1 Tax=Nocardia takedensis TaxID=259390 RepID=UPI003F77790A